MFQHPPLYYWMLMKRVNLHLILLLLFIISKTSQKHQLPYQTIPSRMKRPITWKEMSCKVVGSFSSAKETNAEDIFVGVLGRGAQFNALRPEGRRFESHSGRLVRTLG